MIISILYRFINIFESPFNSNAPFISNMKKFVLRRGFFTFFFFLIKLPFQKYKRFSIILIKNPPLKL